MSEMKKFNFYGAYNTADLINRVLRGDFGDDDTDSFIAELDKNQFSSMATFPKQTLFHAFIKYVLECVHYEEIRHIYKYSPVVISEVEEMYTLFDQYEIEYTSLELTQEDIDVEEVDSVDVVAWIDAHEASFDRLFEMMTGEAFHVLFRDRELLKTFNSFVAETMGSRSDFPKGLARRNGCLKRKSTPAWLKRAVFHRDRGLCVFCNKDLTGKFNTLARVNFDHIVPLSKHGINDATNIQLLCADCNLVKSNKNEETSNDYEVWW